MKITALFKRLFLASIFPFVSGFLDEAGGKTFDIMWDVLGPSIRSGDHP